MPTPMTRKGADSLTSLLSWTRTCCHSAGKVCGVRKEFRYRRKAFPVLDVVKVLFGSSFCNVPQQQKRLNATPPREFLNMHVEGSCCPERMMTILHSTWFYASENLPPASTPPINKLAPSLTRSHIGTFVFRDMIPGLVQLAFEQTL